MKATRYILMYIMSVMAIGAFAQVSPPTQPQPQPTNPIQPPTTNPTTQQQPASPTQQTNPTMPATSSMGIPAVTDPTTTQKLQSDFQTQGTTLGNQPVNWYNNSGNGYIGTTSYNNTNYMIQYDNQGSFQQTFTQGDWNGSNVPSTLKSSFKNSQYGSQQVTGYWISSDPDQKSYYLQTTDDQGKVTGVWADENGKLSDTPPKSNNPK